MKLISEFVENDIEFLITEDKNTGKKNYGIQGIFAQAETKNRNGRIYPMDVMESAVGKYIDGMVSISFTSDPFNHTAFIINNKRPRCFIETNQTI